jgi:hypothetical protein
MSSVGSNEAILEQTEYFLKPEDENEVLDYSMTYDPGMPDSLKYKTKTVPQNHSRKSKKQKKVKVLNQNFIIQDHEKENIDQTN